MENFNAISWINTLPSGWKAVKLKYLLEQGKGSMKVGPFGSQLSGKDFTDEGYWVYNQKVVVNQDFDETDAFISEDKYNSMDGFQVETGDILITTRGTIGRICRVPKVYHPGIIHPCIIKFRIDEEKVLYNLVRLLFNESNMIKDQLDFMSNATTIDVVYSEPLKNVYIPIAPLNVQCKLTSYLQDKCSDIDTMTADIQSEIDTLEKYKRSVITEAVTKGLDKNAELKDSGIKWIKQIPKTWKIIPSKYLFHNSDERKHKNDVQLTASQKYGIISQKDYMRRESAKIVLANQGIENWKHVKPDDFIISLRSFQGGLEMSDITGCITWHYVVLRATKPIYPKFYKWLFKSSQYINALQSTCSFIRDGQDLRFSNFAKVPLFEPPLGEQKRIAEFLEKECSNLDESISLLNKQLETLAAYKKSLIYEYVTGKKEVPSSWQN